MKLLTTDQAKQLDHVAINKHLIPGESLMGNAGIAIAKQALLMIQNISKPTILIVCGKGNNGGDGFATAIELFKNNYSIHIHSIPLEPNINGEALVYFKECMKYEIPITFGYKIGVATIVLYLFEGILGLPVFSNSPEKGIGISYFLGPTMGYLIGFIFASFLAGYFKYNSNYLLTFFKLAISTSIIYLFGVLWLGNLIGWDKPILEFGVYPFLFAELFKLLLLTALIKKITLIKKII